MNHQQNYNQNYVQAGGYPNQQYQQPQYLPYINGSNNYYSNIPSCPPPDFQQNNVEQYANNNLPQSMTNAPINNTFQQPMSNTSYNNLNQQTPENYQQPVNNYQQNNCFPTNNYQPMNNYQQPNINFQQPINNFQQPMNNYQQINNSGMPINDISQPMGSTQQTMPNLSKVNNGIAAPGLIQGPKLAKFFVDIKKRLNRDYIVIMDMSGSMRGQKWEQAKNATMQIAPFACQGDPDGITLYLFSGEFFKYEHLQHAEQVREIFNQQQPRGQTNMTAVLRSAFNDHFTGNKPTTILVVTDGAPDSQSTTTREIVGATNKINSQEDLSISFIQIGENPRASKYLKFLDDSLVSQGAKFDIVDTLTAAEAGSISFDQLVQRSIYD